MGNLILPIQCDPQTGEIFNFGISPGLNATLNVYKSDRTGRIVQKAAVELEGFLSCMTLSWLGNTWCFLFLQCG